MFDIGFFELLLIAVVGLVVIGPERLPGAIRTGALWWGRLKRSIRETRSELEKQLGADDVRRELHNEEVMRSLEALRHTQRDVEQQLQDARDEVSYTAEAEAEPATEAKAEAGADTEAAAEDQRNQTPPDHENTGTQHRHE